MSVIRFSKVELERLGGYVEDQVVCVCAEHAEQMPVVYREKVTARIVDDEADCEFCEAAGIKEEKELIIGREDYEERQEARRDRYEAKADKAQRESERQYKASNDATAGIPFGQPILVGHHSEGRHRAAIKRAQNAATRSVEEYEKAEHYAGKADGVGKGGISSDDPEAVVKLREKIAALEGQRDLMKKVNRSYKKHEGDWEAVQKETGVSDAFVEVAKHNLGVLEGRVTWGSTRPPVPLVSSGQRPHGGGRAGGG